MQLKNSWILKHPNVCAITLDPPHRQTYGGAVSWQHYDDVRMGAIVSQITSLTIVYSIVYSDADQRKHQSSASLAFVRVIHRGPVNFPHKWPVTRKMFPLDDVIMATAWLPKFLPSNGHNCFLACYSIWADSEWFVSVAAKMVWSDRSWRYLCGDQCEQCESVFKSFFHCVWRGRPLGGYHAVAVISWYLKILCKFCQTKNLGPFFYMKNICFVSLNSILNHICCLILENTLQLQLICVLNVSVMENFSCIHTSLNPVCMIT